MKSKKAAQSLRRIADKVLTEKDLAKEIIIQRGNTYHAFGHYTIKEVEGGWQVTSNLIRDTLLFSTAKVALSWCLFFKVGMIEEATQVHWLDDRIVARQADIDILTERLSDGKNLENRAVLLARLSENISTRQSYKKQLAKCLHHAKYIKLIKGTKK